MKLPAALALGLLLLGSVGTAPAHDGAWHDIGQESLARGLVFEDLTPAGANGRCKEGFELRLPGGRIGCTHGPDPAPPGRDVREPLTMGDIAATTTGDPSEGGAS